MEGKIAQELVIVVPVLGKFARVIRMIVKLSATSDRRNEMARVNWGEI